MKFTKKYPAIALTSFVRHYWYFELDAAEAPFEQLSFPYGAFELICYLENPNTMRWTGSGENFTEPSIFYAGQLTQSFTMSFDKPCKCIGASLYPWAGNLLYNTPANEFTNALVPLDDLEKGNNLYTELMSSQNPQLLFVCLENYLLQKLLSRQVDPLVQDLAMKIIREPVRDILNGHLAGINLSRRRIEQRFIESTGLTLGGFMGKMRFQKAVHLLKKQTTDTSLTIIGLNAGYYDQAHFINDFKTFSGMSPNNFRRQQTALKDFFNTLVLVA